MSTSQNDLSSQNVADGRESNDTAYYGIFEITSWISGYSVNAWFRSQASPAVNLGDRITVSSLLLNNDTVSYDFGEDLYHASFQKDLSETIWTVNGANGIPSFSIRINSPQPNCSDHEVLPDSISKRSDFLIEINGVSNSTSAFLNLYDGSSQFISTKIRNGDNTIKINSSRLDNFATEKPCASISVYLYNDRAFNFGGKSFKFSRICSFGKHIKIKS